MNSSIKSAAGFHGQHQNIQVLCTIEALSQSFRWHITFKSVCDGVGLV